MLGRLLFILTLVLTVLQMASDIALGRSDRLLESCYVLGYVGIFAILGLWLYARGQARPVANIYIVEAITLIVTSTLWSVSCQMLSEIVMPDMLSSVFSLLSNSDVFRAGSILSTYLMTMVMMLAATQFLAARAALVPSSAIHTALLALACGAPIILSSGVISLPFWKISSHQFLSISDRWFIGIFSTIWWMITVVICAVLAGVIHRMRREVHEAKQLGQYVLQERLGQGGMGEVYRANHAMMRRPTAIKLLPLERAGAENLARFEREVQLCAKLTHPNTISIYDYGRTPDGIFYYAMELLNGATLEEMVACSGPQPASRVIFLLKMIAGSLAEAHGQGLIHRDIKPSNIYVCERGGQYDFIKVLDFGLVKLTNQAGDSALSQLGTLVGTPLYMSPEAITTPEAIDHRSDLYSLGAVGYFLITSTHLFTEKNPVQVYAHQLHTPPEPPSARVGFSLPQDLESLLLDCLSKDPALRPQSALEILSRLERCQDNGAWSFQDAHDWWQHNSGNIRQWCQSKECISTLDQEPTVLR